MKFGDYTGITDLEKLLAMVQDDSPGTDKRMMAVLDLSMSDNFDAHHLLDFVLDKSQPSALRGEIFDQHSWGWDERAIPVILEALQEDNKEIQFWAAFALVTLRWYWQQSDLEQIISALDSLVQNENIAPGMWHVGREALYPLERAYYRQINDAQTDSISFKLISPRLEYWDFKMAQGKNEAILEPALRLDPVWLQKQIQSRFQSAKFSVRRPKIEAYLLDWKIGYGRYPLFGALHRDGYGIVLTGKEVSIRRFADWYRSIVSDDHELGLYEWADSGEKL